MSGRAIPITPVRSRRGLTLLELLAALALLGLFIGAGSAWLGALARAHAAVSLGTPDRLALERVVAAIGRDLEEAWRTAGEGDGRRAQEFPTSFDEEQDTLELTTTHAAGGAEPGWRWVRWRFDAASRTLLREERLIAVGAGQWTTRRAAIRIEAFDIVRVENSTTPGDEEGAESFEVAVTSDRDGRASLTWEVPR